MHTKEMMGFPYNGSIAAVSGTRECPSTKHTYCIDTWKDGRGPASSEPPTGSLFLITFVLDIVDAYSTRSLVCMWVCVCHSTESSDFIYDLLRFHSLFLRLFSISLFDRETSRYQRVSSDWQAGDIRRRLCGCYCARKGDIDFVFRKQKSFWPDMTPFF